MRRAARVRRDEGFSIAEVIVAQLLLLVGLLGLAATASVVASRLGSAELQTRVRVAAQAELERLLAGGHPRLVSGQSQREALQLEWQVGGGDPKRIVLVVRGTEGRREEVDTLETLVPR